MSHCTPPHRRRADAQDPISFAAEDDAGPEGIPGVAAATNTDALVLGPPEAQWDEEEGSGGLLPQHPVNPQDALFVPAALNRHLREYQREGVRFLYKLYAAGKGGVLADDMGLGKTIQTIAFLAAILRSPVARDIDTGAPPSPVLIVCPASVLANWERELKKWGKHLDREFVMVRVHGQQKGDAWKRVVLRGVDHEDLVEVVLTTHSMFRNEVDAFKKVSWSACVFDEAHALKNRKAQLYSAAVQLPTARRYGLTGTAMQNSYEELWALFDWACPHCLGPLNIFKEYYSRPMQLAQQHSATERELGKGRERAQKLAALLRKYMLKRAKAEVLAGEMPTKVDNVVFCELSPLQLRVYKRLLESEDFQLLVRHAEDCECGSREKRSRCCYSRPVGGPDDAPIWHSFDHGTHGALCPYCICLVCMSYLSKVSNHLELLKPDPLDSDEKFARDSYVSQLAFGDEAHLVGDAAHADKNFERVSDAKHCGKLLALEKLLAIWKRADDKVLLFSCSVRLLDILEKFLARQGYVFCRLDGSTPTNERQRVVDDFNTSGSMFIFLLSTKAGGVGLNITSANRVVIFDPNWNPSIDLQAQDRAYRMGQQRDVDVYRFLTSGTLEEMVYQRQVYKQQQSNVALDAVKERRYFEGVQGDKENPGELFGISNMFALASEELVRMQELVAREKKSTDDFYRIEQVKVENHETGGDGGSRGGGGSQPHCQIHSGAGVSGGVADNGMATDAEVAMIDEPGNGGGGDKRGGTETEAGGKRRGRGQSRGRGRGFAAFRKEEDGVLYEHQHASIVGNPSREEDARSRRAIQVARDAGDLRDNDFPGAGRGRGQGRGRGEKRRRAAGGQAETAAAAATADTTETAEASNAATDAEDVIAILAAFEGTTQLEMARRLVEMDTGGRAALLRRFLVAKGAA